MTSGDYYGGNLTEDEAEVFTIVNGVEKQASQIHTRRERAKNLGLFLNWTAIGGFSTAAVSEFGPQFQVLEGYRYSGSAIGALAAVGGLVQVLRARRMRQERAQKLELADKLREELDTQFLDYSFPDSQK
jgi:hypothetical protein